MRFENLVEKADSFQGGNLVNKEHSQDGITYEVTTIRADDGSFSVFLHVTKLDNLDLSDDRLAATIFGESYENNKGS